MMEIDEARDVAEQCADWLASVVAEGHDAKDGGKLPDFVEAIRLLLVGLSVYANDREHWQRDQRRIDKLTEELNTARALVELRGHEVTRLADEHGRLVARRDELEKSFAFALDLSLTGCQSAVPEDISKGILAEVRTALRDVQRPAWWDRHMRIVMLTDAQVDDLRKLRAYVDNPKRRDAIGGRATDLINSLVGAP